MNKNIGELPKTRLAYLDNVRSLVIFLVIAMHAAVTYSGLGDWYYTEGSPEKLSIIGIVFFGFLQSHLQAWIMGVLFFISAYLASKALTRHSSFKFIKERLFRLGLLLLIYVFIITPFIHIIMHYVFFRDYNPDISPAQEYIQYITNFWWLGGTGPLWFVQALLIFCAVYVLFKKCFHVFIKINKIDSKKIILTVLITGISAFLIRLVFPIGSNFLNLQFSYFASYIVMFIAGIIVGENDLLENLTDKKNIKWIKLSLIIGTPIWVITMLFGGAIDGNMNHEGGLCWQSLTFALWESLIAIGFSLGLIALFKKKVNTSNKFAVLVRENAFSIYFFHALMMVTISLLIRSIFYGFWYGIDPIFKFAIVTIITFILCLVFSYLIRKIKPIGTLFK